MSAAQMGETDAGRTTARGIDLERIHKSFDANPVLRGVDLKLKPGTVTALIGPSGSGKSTLLRCVNLLETPESGALSVGDLRIQFQQRNGVAVPPPRERVLAIRRRTGMVFQNFQLFPHLTVLQNVTEGLVTVLKWQKDRARERGLELLAKVGIVDKADAWPLTLSGGQQQRVAIARALAPSPQVLLCDEPTSALDPSLAAEVVDVLRRLASEGMTMLMATHDLRLAASVALHVVFLEGGLIAEEGPPERIFGDPQQDATRRFVASLTGSQGATGAASGS